LQNRYQNIPLHFTDHYVSATATEQMHLTTTIITTSITYDIKYNAFNFKKSVNVSLI